MDETVPAIEFRDRTWKPKTSAHKTVSHEARKILFVVYLSVVVTNDGVVVGIRIIRTNNSI